MLYWPSKDAMLEDQKMRCLPANSLKIQEFLLEINRKLKTSRMLIIFLEIGKIPTTLHQHLSKFNENPLKIYAAKVCRKLWKKFDETLLKY